ncbi:PEGA domain-containing protein [Patescibacteria group bacterium]|nr:PEGA domain-containing protein [Patescibacteria group bacterium]
MSKKINFIFFIVFSIIAVLTTAFVIITYSGYKIDFKYMRLIKTGSIYINTNPTKADIYIDNKKIDQRTPAIINHVIPGRHTITLEKKGYKTWETNIDVPPEITTFLNYELIYEDIELSKTSELSNQPLILSNNKRYILYIKHENNLNNIYVYDIASQEQFKIYSTISNIGRIEWAPDDKRVLLLENSKFLVINLNIIELPVINNAIQSYKLINLNTLIPDIADIIWNQLADNILVITNDKQLYKVDINSEEITKININDFGRIGLFINDKIIYINSQNILREYNISSDLTNEYIDYNNIKNIKYYDDYIVLLNNQDMFIIFRKDLKSEPIKLSGERIEFNKNRVITFNNSEINIYDLREGVLNNTLRYGKKIIDLDFYNNNYIVLILEDEIKLINIDGSSLNELNLISNIKSIQHVIVLDNRINIIYKDGDSYMISHIDLR